ncbi:hypothetical protein BJY04DRAFT_233168 [Aspergillus karnatakaensis]|uniref:uncharacterized protein n=1 Tax=Aspergillus karnatakaensis TaxID=1810916 RepID=UPI003CCD889F
MYQLTHDDIDNVYDDDTPVIRAAANPNIAVLEAQLAFYERLEKVRQGQPVDTLRYRSVIRALNPNTTIDCYGTINSPINAAVGANLPDHLRLLLAKGADPNGINRSTLIGHSVFWVRGRHFQSCCIFSDRPRALLYARNRTGVAHPVCPLTEAELADRRRGFAQFWTDPDAPGGGLRSSRRPQRALTSLELAAMDGNIEMLDILRAGGADESAWLQPEPNTVTDDVSKADHEKSLFDIDNGDNVPTSALSTTSPVHEAIAAGRVQMLWHLLSTCGHSPNYRPRAAPTIALTPLSYAVACCDLKDPGVQRCLVDLLSHPQLDANLRTPVYNIHPLHFATAHHNPEFLSWLAASIPGEFAAAGQTALGHTLLHVASLPLHAGHIDISLENTATSIHCLRTLASRWAPYCLPNQLLKSYKTPAEVALHPCNADWMTESQQQAQQATIELIIEQGGCDVRAQDVDGNTALHYLAGTRNIDPATVRIVLGMDGGEEAWHSARNHWGLTPKDLWPSLFHPFFF